MSSPTDGPKYLACARALALLTGVAGGLTVCGATTAAHASEPPATTPASTPDAGDAGAPPVYDGGPHGTLVRNSDGCDVGAGTVSPGAAALATVAGAGLLARRRRRRDVP
ncbi:MAG TPA: hypothetical protein VHM31_10705 [Polyangia bacterium]|nr:hypothetical protein [Polyangia bacterium]